MPQQRRPLSKSEMEVARIVWVLKDASVRQVHEALSKERKVDFKTVQTYLRRLESKGYLRTKLQGKNKVYSSRVSPSRVIRQTVEDFVARLFAGETLPLFQHLIHERGLSAEEIQKLREMLNKLKEEK